MPDAPSKSPSAATPDWHEVVARIRRGDRVAFVTLARFVTGFLSRWRAFDFRDDWDDMVQDVVLAVCEAHREGRLESSGAVAGFLKQTARFKFIDRLRALGREAPDHDATELTESGASPWPPGGGEGLSSEGRVAVWEALDHLPERSRTAVIEVYVRGRTYEEAAEHVQLPLGTLKRALREGLAALRAELADG